MRLLFHLHFFRDEQAMRTDDIANLVVEYRGRVIELSCFSRCKHQAHAACIEEREIRRSEEKFHAEHVAVERCSARDVLYVDCDLPNGVEVYRISSRFHLSSRFVQSALADARIIS